MGPVCGCDALPELILSLIKTVSVEQSRKISDFAKDAGIVDSNPRGGGIFCDFSGLYRRSINVDSAGGGINRIF